MMGARRRRGFELPDRPRRGRLLLGVCAGIAEHYHVDVTLVRLAFLLLSLAWGLGALLYLAIWIVTPTAGSGPVRDLRSMMGRNVRSARLEMARSRRSIRGAWKNEGTMATWPRPMGRRWLGLGLVIVGAAILLASLGVLSWVTPWRAFALGAMALGVATLISLNRT